MFARSDVKCYKPGPSCTALWIQKLPTKTLKWLELDLVSLFIILAVPRMSTEYTSAIWNPQRVAEISCVRREDVRTPEVSGRLRDKTDLILWAYRYLYATTGEQPSWVCYRPAPSY
jgi:hypothetical protein